MNRIHLLTEQVANQIAAGEVVERPASVVKELVENSLDAQASRITVEIQAGGRSLIRVTDDGSGMGRDDALLCLERHATSKIQRAEDLSSIFTMGFRGEAVPSIASVSRFTLTTRERDSESPEGTQILINGGKIIEVKTAGSATGTSIEVRQLFFNLPARRKFLRSEETEASHIQHYLTLAALANPQVAFTLSKDGRLTWQLPAVPSPANDRTAQLAALRERIRALQGDGLKLLPVNFTAEMVEHASRFEEEVEAHALHEGAPERRTFKLWGFIGAPGVSRSTREDQHLFVNRRPVENRGLNFALMEGYHNSLMKGKFPVCCLFLEIDPAAVDVNIHPAKREIKFHSDMQVRRLVAQAIRETLLRFHTNQGEAHPQPAFTPPAAPKLVLRSEIEVQSPPEQQSFFTNPKLAAPLPKAVAQPSTIPSRPLAEVTSTTANTSAPFVPAIAPVPLVMAQPGVTATAVPLLQVPMRMVGVVGKLYVVLESDRGLVLLDQHAAHERILFEQMLNRLEQSGASPSQKLLLPETVELSIRDSQFLREQLPLLSRFGVGLSEFGERTFLLDALPPFVKVTDPRQFVITLVDELKSAGQEMNSVRLGEHTVAKTVCRHAVKANDSLAGRELENLVEDLRRCTMPYTCPHGRPTLIEMNYRELEKKFGRSQ
jgi:DNA mismatch repair protein MutL